MDLSTLSLSKVMEKDTTLSSSVHSTMFGSEKSNKTGQNGCVLLRAANGFLLHQDQLFKMLLNSCSTGNKIPSNQRIQPFKF